MDAQLLCQTKNGTLRIAMIDFSVILLVAFLENNTVTMQNIIGCFVRLKATTGV